MYTIRGLIAGLSGDIELAPNGDLKLGNSFETVRDSVNFIVRTQKGEYAPDGRVGGNIGAGIGERMSKETTIDIEDTLRENLSRFILNPSDFRVHAFPLSEEELGVFVAVAGQYLDNDGNVLETEAEVLSYIFPFFEGDPTPVSE